MQALLLCFAQCRVLGNYFHAMGTGSSPLLPLHPPPPPAVHLRRRAAPPRPTLLVGDLSACRAAFERLQQRALELSLQQQAAVDEWEDGPQSTGAWLPGLQTVGRQVTRRGIHQIPGAL